jgi:hypothetical protein
MHSESESYITTGGQSTSLSWNKKTIWGLRPDFYYCQTVVCLLFWGALSDERTDLSFTISADPRQRSHSWITVPWDSRPYFTVSDSRHPFSSPHTTSRVTVEVFDHASSRVVFISKSQSESESESGSELLYDWRFTANQFVLAPNPLRLTARVFFRLNTCGHSPYVTSSLMRGWGCRLPLLLARASAFTLRSESRRTHDRILLFQIRESPNLESRSPYLYPPGTEWPSYNPRHKVPFPSRFTKRGAMVDIIRTLLHTLEGQSAIP